MKLYGNSLNSAFKVLVVTKDSGPFGTTWMIFQSQISTHFVTGREPRKGAQTFYVFYTPSQSIYGHLVQFGAL